MKASPRNWSAAGVWRELDGLVLVAARAILTCFPLWTASVAVGQGPGASGARLAMVPNPVLVSPPGMVGRATLVWNAPGFAEVEIRVGSPEGPILAVGGSSGISGTGTDVGDGVTFWLVAPPASSRVGGDRTLATVTAMTKPFPQIWFHPNDNLQRPWQNFIGSLDYWDLFQANAPWGKAAEGVQVFGLGWFLTAEVPDSQLRPMLQDLNRRQMLISLDAEPLVVEDGCSGGGYSLPGQVAAWLRRIKSLGAEVAYITLDEPVFYATYYQPNPCRWPLDKIARNVSDHVKSMREVFPDLKVIEIEPVGTAEGWADSTIGFLDAYRRASGEPFAGFQADVSYKGLGDWHGSVATVAAAAASRGIPFGVIYQGWSDESSDVAFTGAAEQYLSDVESLMTLIPEMAVFQSWTDLPDYVLPENTPGTFTNLLKRYQRKRSYVTLAVDPVSSTAQAVVVEHDGTPIRGNVALNSLAVSGEGSVQDYVFTGLVPLDTTQAFLAVRANNPGTFKGFNDLFIHSGRYSEGDDVNRVTNPDFSDGLNGWGFSGYGRATLEPSDSGVGQVLHIVASATQVANLNSLPFQVTPNRSFRAVIAARVRPSSDGEGEFGVIFFRGRDQGYFEYHVFDQIAPLARTLNTLGSDERGFLRMSFDGSKVGGHVLFASYAGDETHWPACIADGGSPCGLRIARAGVPAYIVCPGDCDGEGSVTVDEILTMVNIALGIASPSRCTAGDVNHDDRIEVDEILTGVSNALYGCARDS